MATAAKDITGPACPRVARRGRADGRLAIDAATHHARGGPEIDLDALAQQHLGAIAGAFAVVALLLLAGLLLQARRIGRLSRRLDGLTRGSDGASLEAVLGQHLERVRSVVRDLDRLDNRTSAVER
ncbi:MAG TPA: hypothetical protein VET90_00175, partial [Candidatus Binatus sp.]|nr:hypothetical protein [Candidatus Binatus sp.]